MAPSETNKTGETPSGSKVAPVAAPSSSASTTSNKQRSIRRPTVRVARAKTDPGTLSRAGSLKKLKAENTEKEFAIHLTCPPPNSSQTLACRHCFQAHSRICTPDFSAHGPEIVSSLSLSQPEASLEPAFNQMMAHAQSFQTDESSNPKSTSKGLLLILNPEESGNSPWMTVLGKLGPTPAAVCPEIEQQKVKISELELEIRRLKQQLEGLSSQGSAHSSELPQSPPSSGEAPSPEETLPKSLTTPLSEPNSEMDTANLPPVLQEFIQQLALRDKERRSRLVKEAAQSKPQTATSSTKKTREPFVKKK